MSMFKVPYTTILTINPHPDPETTRLEIATIYGFQVVIPKGRYKVGDCIIYTPIDSILNQELEALIFGKDSKIKLNKGRVRQIRIRKVASQGMVIDPSDVSSLINIKKYTLEDDLSEVLGITKYEPPAPKVQTPSGGKKQRNQKVDNPHLHGYNGVDNIKWFVEYYKETDEVVIQEKLHGTNARAGRMPYIPRTIIQKIKRFFGLLPTYENCYGSNNVQISSRSDYTGYYGEDVYGAVFKKLDVFSKIKQNEAVYGEIIGPSIQKNYDYGLKEHKFVLFDVKILQEDGSQKWLSPKEVAEYAKERGFDLVPVLYEGLYNKDLAYALTKGPSVYDPGTPVREGIVIKSANDYDKGGNKTALKWVSEDYLDNKNNSDFH